MRSPQTHGVVNSSVNYRGWGRNRVLTVASIIGGGVKTGVLIVASIIGDGVEIGC